MIVFFCDYRQLVTGDSRSHDHRAGNDQDRPPRCLAVFTPEWVEAIFASERYLLPGHQHRSGPDDPAAHRPAGVYAVQALPGALFSLRFAPRLGSAHYPLRLARYRCCPHDGGTPSRFITAPTIAGLPLRDQQQAVRAALGKRR